MGVHTNASTFLCPVYYFFLENICFLLSSTGYRSLKGKKALKWSWPNFYITRSWQLKTKRLLISFSYPLRIIHNMTTATGESTKRQDIQEIGPNIQAYLIRRQCCRKAESCRRCSAEWIVQKDFLQHTRIKQLHMFRITSIMTHSDTTGRGEW